LAFVTALYELNRLPTILPVHLIFRVTG